MKSPVKWAGGKAQLLDMLLPLIEERRSPGGTLFDVFLGGGSVALAADEDTLVVTNDASDDLMDMWLGIRDRPRQVADVLEVWGRAHSPEHYKLVRSSLGASLTLRAARFLYLNKLGFNGLYRVNKAGQFNVPIGRGRPTSLPTYGELLTLQQRMRRSWTLQCGDFEDVCEAAREGDVIFADPPYDGTHDYSSGFGDGDRMRLAACLRRAARRGVGVVACDADTPLVRRLYAWADVRDVSERRRISAKVDGRGDAACVVAVRP